jgi:hypothetical protein
MEAGLILGSGIAALIGFWSKLRWWVRVTLILLILYFLWPVTKANPLFPRTFLLLGLMIGFVATVSILLFRKWVRSKQRTALGGPFRRALAFFLSKN